MTVLYIDLATWTTSTAVWTVRPPRGPDNSYLAASDTALKIYLTLTRCIGHTFVANKSILDFVMSCLHMCT